MKIKLLSAAALLLSACLPSAFAQNFATISGTITDKSGAAVGSAKVSAQNMETLVSREVVADASGLYNFPLLQPGRYKLSAQQPGFKATVQDNIRLEVNQSARIDLQLEVGQVSETIEVTSSAPLLEENSSTIG